MPTRKIKVVSTLSDVFVIETAETSFDAFMSMSEFTSKINPNNMRMRVRPGTGVEARTLEAGDTLPNVDFVMFISPKKVKSGIVIA